MCVCVCVCVCVFTPGSAAQGQTQKGGRGSGRRLAGVKCTMTPPVLAMNAFFLWCAFSCGITTTKKKERERERKGGREKKNKYKESKKEKKFRSNLNLVGLSSNRCTSCFFFRMWWAAALAVLGLALVVRLALVLRGRQAPHAPPHRTLVVLGSGIARRPVWESALTRWFLQGGTRPRCCASCRACLVTARLWRLRSGVIHNHGSPAGAYYPRLYVSATTDTLSEQHARK